MTDIKTLVSVELLPCPFCGDGYPEIRGEGREWFVACSNAEECGAEGHRALVDGYAVGTWNRRSLPPSREAGEAVAWRWRYDDEALWSYGPEKPTKHRFGEPVAIDPLFAAPPASSAEVSTLKAEVERMRKASEWQPIETAPKDGTDILLAGRIPEGWRVTEGHWTTDEECRVHVGDCGGECRCPEYEYEDPSWLSWDGGFCEPWPATHWMPLPGAPALHEVEEG